MPTAAKGQPGRKPKPAALRRTAVLQVRLNPVEKTAAEARAQQAGLKLSDYARLQICGAAPEQTASRVGEVKRQRKAERIAPGDRNAIEERIRRENPGMPKHSVRVLAGRELQRS